MKISSNLRVSGILNKFKNSSNKKSALALFLLIIFFCVVFVFVRDVKIENEEIPNYDELIKNPNEKFDELTENRKIKEIIEGEQFGKMDYEDNLIREYKKEKEGNLFEKKF